MYYTNNKVNSYVMTGDGLLWEAKGTQILSQSKVPEFSSRQRGAPGAAGLPAGTGLAGAGKGPASSAGCVGFPPLFSLSWACPVKGLSRVIRKRLFGGVFFVGSELVLPGKFVLFIGLIFSPRRVMNVSRPENGPPPRAGKSRRAREVHP